MYASHISRTHRKFGEEGAAAWPAGGGTGNSGYARRNEGRTDTRPAGGGEKEIQQLSLTNKISSK
jgi:hypothetical protein